MNQFVAARMLKTFDVEHDIVENGRDAVKAFQEVDYDVILMVSCSMTSF